RRWSSRSCSRCGWRNGSPASRRRACTPPLPERMRKLAWLCAVLCAPAAAAFDPRYGWLTMDTPHFEIHFHQGEYAFAAKVARIAEEAHARLSPLLDHQPSERTQIVLTDDTDSANGSATPLFYNLV